MSSSDYRFALGGHDHSARARAPEPQASREVNEGFANLTKRFALHPASDPSMMVVCECGREDCMTLVETRLSEYEAVRAGPARRVVVSAHIDQLTDSILARRNGYALIHQASSRLSTEAPAPRKESTSPPTANSLQR